MNIIKSASLIVFNLWAIINANFPLSSDLFASMIFCSNLKSRLEVTSSNIYNCVISVWQRGYFLI